MPNLILNNNDNIQTMLNKSRFLMKNLHCIKGKFGKKQYINEDKFEVIYTDKFLYGVEEFNRDRSILETELHTLYDCLENFYKSFENQGKYSFEEIEQIKTDIKNILFITYQTILEPTESNCKKMETYAQRVHGHGSIGKKIGIALATIIGLLGGIVPGLILMCAFENVWYKSKQQGLSLEIEEPLQNVVKSLKCKNYNLPSLILSYSFYKPTHLVLQESQRDRESHNNDNSSMTL